MKKYFLLFFLAGFVVFVDQVTKLFIRDQSFTVFSFFRITPTYNSGALFGIFPGGNVVFIVLSIAVLGLIIYLYKNADQLSQIGFSLIFGGAIGNLVDRLFGGAVYDFLDFKIWPIFNFADTFLVLGVVLVLFVSLRGHKFFSVDKNTLR
ncbi:signal peptidase II [Candidatus Woesearchaeota archaeon]|nr:signal peptidase II [Candidatus Woesearchaeota archaeon]